jgi:lipopolysaccharide transport system ATP-binding protein
MPIVIEVKGLSKKYRIGKADKRSDTVVGALVNSFKQPFQNLKQIRSLSKLDEDEASIFWALRNVSFEVKEGDVLGIIGHNGAGKSTLLKILSRITEPSEGEVRIKGRVAALLEVGTGFHAELTGRENIYMNGTILGMRKKEIDGKLDEIVDFSGVEKFLDTPVKFYSSGMRVRLGFSVAAHLEPEILIIDEVLAVGDAEFQMKCLGKMEAVAAHGRTVLFVSHNLATINSLCSKTLLIDKGTFKSLGETKDIIREYSNSIKHHERAGKLSVVVTYEDDLTCWNVNSTISIKFLYEPEFKGQLIDVTFYNNYGTKVFGIEGGKQASGHLLRLGEFDSIKLINTGVVNTTLSVDIGVKDHLNSSYLYVARSTAIVDTEEISILSSMNGQFIFKMEVE